MLNRFFLGLTLFCLFVFLGQRALSSTEKICRAPAACLLPDQPCVGSQECCSGLCNNNVCAPFAGDSCGFPGEVCEFNKECCSGACLNNTCLGSPRYPAFPGSPCQYSNECQSRNCDPEFKVCLGSQKSCAQSFSLCRFSQECCSGFCNPKTSTCQSIGENPLDPPRRGSPCEFNFQCPNYCHPEKKYCL